MHELLLSLGGLLAGMINTLAGNGTVITMSLCTEIIGLSPSIANGTNRLGVLTQSITGSYGLYKRKKLLLQGTYQAMECMMAGAILGIWIATVINDAMFRKIYPWFLVFVFVVLILRPERWLKPATDLDYKPPFYIWFIYFLVGIYGGLIQLGVGVFFLAATIMLHRLPWSHANAAKIFVVGLFTIIAVIVFSRKGLFDLHTAIFLAIGQSLGAWLAVRYLHHLPQAHKISYYILLAVTGATILKQFLW